MRHVVMLSSGVGSAVAAKRVAEREGTDDLYLLFADVNGEDEDNYRFLSEVAPWIGGQLVVIDNGGKTIWDVFRERKFLGNTMVDPCSDELKRKAMRTWLETHCDHDDTICYLGFDVSEGDRIERAKPYWVPWRVESPLADEPVIWKDQAIEMVLAAGIQPPLLTRMGFPHANCGGGCVKAGQGQFRKLLMERPAEYAKWEHEEEGVRVFLGKDVSILRDRRKAAPKIQLTLREFRERLGVDPTDYDPNDASSCSCMGYVDVEVAK